MEPRPQLPVFPPRYEGPPTILGSGGFATVFLVRDTATDRPVAAKVLQRSSYEPGFGSTFNAEVRATARLMHPGVVQLLDTGLTEQGQPFLVMEYADAGSMQRICDEPPPWPRLRDLFLELLDTLAFIHARGVLHRDIKPENVLLATGPDGVVRVKVADLGIAKLSEVTGYHDRTDSTRGTPAYMAPEQMEGSGLHLGPWTDLYAVGCMLHAALSGAPPFSGNPWSLMYRKLAGAPPPLAIRGGYGAPDGVGAIVSGLLAREPDARYQAAADVRAALLSLGDPDPSRPARADGPPAEDVPPSGKPDLFGGPPRWHAPQRPPFPEAPPEEPRCQVTAGTSPEMFLLRRPPLVDREEPRRRLWDTVRAVLRERAPHTAVLAGEAGVGKGRLAHWLHEALERDGRVRTLFVDHDPEPGSVGAGITEAVRRFLGCAGLDTDALRLRLERYLELHGERDPEELDALMAWLGPIAGAAGPAVDLQSRNALLHRVLKRAARGGGVLVWFQDIQWSADGESFRLLRDLRLLLEIDPAPVMFLATLRPEETANSPRVAREVERLRGRDQVAWIALDRLGLDDGRRLLQELLLLEDTLAERVWERGAGNPHFAVQIVAGWLADGLLVETSPLRWGLRQDADVDGSLPRSVEDLSRSRIEGALRRAPNPAMAREVLHGAALVGGPMAFGALWAVLSAGGSGDRQAVRRAWSHLHAEGLLLTREGQTRFDHPLLRETVLRQVSERSDAAEIHLACAAGLRAWSAAAGRDLRGEIAEHLLAAGRAEEALEDLLTAARAAESRDVYRAVRLYRSAMAALDVVGARGDDPRRIVVLRGLGFTAELLGDLQQAEAFLRQALERDTDDVLAASVCCVLAEVVGMRGQFDEALELTERAARILDELEDSPEVARCRARAHRDRAEVLLNQDQGARAVEFLSRSIHEARRAGAEDEALNSLWKLGRTRRLMGDLTAARTDLAAALRRSREAGNRRVESICLRELGNLALIDDDLTRARDLYEATLELHRAGGHELERLATENSRAELARKAGELDAAREGYRAALAIARANALKVEEAVALTNLGLTDLQAGEPAAASAWAGELARLLEDQPSHWLVPFHLVIEATACAELGDWEHFAAVTENIAGLDLARSPDPDLARWLHHSADLAADAGRDAPVLREQARRVESALAGRVSP